MDQDCPQLCIILRKLNDLKIWIGRVNSSQIIRTEQSFRNNKQTFELYLNIVFELTIDQIFIKDNKQ